MNSIEQKSPWSNARADERSDEARDPHKGLRQALGGEARQEEDLHRATESEGLRDYQKLAEDFPHNGAAK